MFARLTAWATALLGRAEIDRAVAYTLLTRGWQALTAPVTLLLVAQTMTLEIQGYYYTFASLLALQSFVELGFYIVIVSVASHEWSRLRLDADGAITGDSVAIARLASLARFISRWYAAASVVFIAAASVAGWATFSRAEGTCLRWWRGFWKCRGSIRPEPRSHASR